MVEGLTMGIWEHARARQSARPAESRRRRPAAAAVVALAVAVGLVASLAPPGPSGAAARPAGQAQGQGQGEEQEQKQGQGQGPDQGQERDREREQERDRGQPSAEVVGGRPVADGTYPFIAALLDRRRGGSAVRQQFCGGTLIDEDSVLTAAHCVEEVGRRDGPRLGDLAVVVGRTVLASAQGEVRAVTAIAIHPRYRGGGFAYDAAVLTLAAPVTNVAPIVLTDGSAAIERPGRRATIAGWGNTRPQPAGRQGRGANFPNRMQRAVVPILPDNRCADAYRGGAKSDDYSPPLMLCAGRENLDACQGDSGGPLFVVAGDGFRQIGLVSYGAGCGSRGFPSGFAQLGAPSIRQFVAAAAG